MSKTKRVPEVIFEGYATTNGKLQIVNIEDLHKYCLEHAEEKLFIHIEPDAQLSKKQKMFAFYYKVVLRCAVLGYTNAGYDGIDAVKCDYMLKAEFAKDFVKKPDGTYVPIIHDKHCMTMPRLNKYINDCILFVEQTLEVEVPDSEAYKMYKQTGKQFKKV